MIAEDKVVVATSLIDGEDKVGKSPFADTRALYRSPACVFDKFGLPPWRCRKSQFNYLKVLNGVGSTTVMTVS